MWIIHTYKFMIVTNEFNVRTPGKNVGVGTVGVSLSGWITGVEPPQYSLQKWNILNIDISIASVSTMY